MLLQDGAPHCTAGENPYSHAQKEKTLAAFSTHEIKRTCLVSPALYQGEGLVDLLAESDID